jgi:AcrR family transcriptional regulator
VVTNLARISAAVAVRHTAEERREEILQAAMTHFGLTGLHGTSTETIAREVGVSQPYLFRLFGTKKELFMEAVRAGFEQTILSFREACEGAADGHEALKRMGDAYLGLIEDRRYLGIQLQAYAATDDPEIRAVVEESFGRLVTEVVRLSDVTPQQLTFFLGRGMLLNVASSMGVLRSPTGWARMIHEGCIGGFHEET